MTYAAVDWGTSSFRLWIMNARGDVLAERRSTEGMVSAAQAGFENVLESHLSAVDATPDTPVVICGMAGARNGWMEAPYLDTPVSLKYLPQAAAKVSGLKRPVFILPGIAQRNIKHADVMRGEETQILGAASFTSASGPAIYCMPGTHSKWVQVVDDRVVRFNTYITGELFDILSNHSIIAHSLNVSDEESAEDNNSFAEAVNEAFAGPEQISNSLFSIRARSLLLKQSPAAARSRLSGLLIGLELAGAIKAEEINSLETITLVGTGKLAQRYLQAFKTINVNVMELDAEQAVRVGLGAAAESLHINPAQRHQA